jgi:hypothetical protein
MRGDAGSGEDLLRHSPPLTRALHAKYGDYTKEQVLLMLQSIQNFIARFPA